MGTFQVHTNTLHIQINNKKSLNTRKSATALVRPLKSVALHGAEIILHPYSAGNKSCK